jgi:hypothetical protein
MRFARPGDLRSLPMRDLEPPSLEPQTSVSCAECAREVSEGEAQTERNTADLTARSAEPSSAVLDNVP